MRESLTSRVSFWIEKTEYHPTLLSYPSLSTLSTQFMAIIHLSKKIKIDGHHTCKRPIQSYWHFSLVYKLSFEWRRQKFWNLTLGYLLPLWFSAFRYGSPYEVREYNVTTAYRLALETWANWINSKINPHTQTVFFMSMSPTHLW